jgi:hypothetical protein
MTAMPTPADIALCKALQNAIDKRYSADPERIRRAFQRHFKDRAPPTATPSGSVLRLT